MNEARPTVRLTLAAIGYFGLGVELVLGISIAAARRRAAVAGSPSAGV
jgi:hypothetical protein